ncbi:phage holin family protein, partial [Clostridium disporicum]
MFKEGLLSLLPAGVVGLFLFYLLSRGVDFATGLLKTWKNKNSYKSRIMRDGIIRWIAEFIALVFVMGLDILLGLNFLISYATLGLFIYKEAGS